jgi:hypothetical protein
MISARTCTAVRSLWEPAAPAWYDADKPEQEPPFSGMDPYLETTLPGSMAICESEGCAGRRETTYQPAIRPT